MSRAPDVFGLALLCLLAAASGCKTGGKRRDRETTAKATHTEQQQPGPHEPLLQGRDANTLDFPLTLRPLEGTVRGTLDRGAVLITADQYKELPTYDLPQLEPGVRRLRDALVETCAVPAAAIAERSGKAAISQEIEGAINRFADEAGGKTALLLVFYTGHGVIDADGQLQLFTYYTDRSGDAFRETIARSELVRWLNRARGRARTRGTELDVVLVVDACRAPTLSARPRAKLVQEETWEVYSTSEGELADAPRKGATPFVEAMCDGLAALAERGEGDVRAVFDVVRRRLEDRDAKQTPQLVAPAESGGPEIVMPGRVRIGLRVVDGLGDTPVYVDEDSVKADGKPLAREGDFFVLDTTIDRTLQLQAAAAGYLPFSRSIAIGRQDNGKTFALPLRPEFTRVRGRVTPAVAVEVAFQCDDDRLVPRTNYHRVVDYTGVNDPEFELLLPTPNATAKSRLIVKQYDRELATVDLDFAAATPDGTTDGVRIIDAGSVALTGADVSALPSASDLDAIPRQATSVFANDAFGGIKPPAQFIELNLQQPAFSDTFQKIRWEEALAAYRADDLRLARTHLQSLVQSMRGTTAPSIANLLGHIEVRLAMEAKTDADVEEQIRAARDGDPALVMALRALLAARKLRQATELAAAGNLDAIFRLREAAAGEPEPGTPYATETRLRIRELRWSIGAALLQQLDRSGRQQDILRAMQQLRADEPEDWNDPDWNRLEQRWAMTPLVQCLREGLDRGLAHGDWMAADEAIEMRRQVFPSAPPQQILDLETTIARERVPLSVRQNFTAAKQAESGGRLNEALRLLQAAREGANSHWKGEIDQLQKQISEQVFRVEMRRGLERRQAGELAAAVDAFANAALAKGGQVRELQDLLREHPELASGPDVRERLAQVDAAQLAAARAARSRQAWQQYLDDQPNGIGVAEARQMLKRLEQPWQLVAPAAKDPALARYGHAMAFDEARGVAVVFGGTRDGNAVLADTWVYDGQTWQKLEPPTSPPARAFHAMVYDPQRRNVVLFGGTLAGGRSVLDDTWFWDGVTWSSLQGATHPPGRAKHAMAFDADRGRVVLYGGGLRDTWEWDGGHWLDLSPRKTNPGKLTSLGMAYSRTDHRILVHGGDGRGGTAWWWDGRSWVSNSRTGVEGRNGATLVAVGDSILRFGGEGRSVTDDLLTYMNGAFGLTRIGAPPSPRMWHASCFDSKRSMLIVHGGMTPPAKRRQPAAVFGDTWEFVVEP